MISRYFACFCVILCNLGFTSEERAEADGLSAEICFQSQIQRTLGQEKPSFAREVVLFFSISQRTAVLFGWLHTWFCCGGFREVRVIVERKGIRWPLTTLGLFCAGVAFWFLAVCTDL